MHLVFLNQYYPPDAAPTGVMLEAVVEELTRQGHAVTVLCAAGGYAGAKREDVVCCPLSVVGGRRGRVANGRSSGAGEVNESRANTTDNRQPTTDHSSPRILRLPASRFGRGTFVGKLTDYASYYLGVAWKLMTLHPRPDRIVALTTPPYLSVLARLISKFRGADHAHWVMDLYPDVMAAHGMLGERSPGYRILVGLARWGFGGRRCAAVLTLGPDMAERVGKYVDEITPKEQRSAEESVGGFSGSQSSALDTQLSCVQWVPLWGAGARVSSPAESMMGESPVRQEPSEAVTVDPFTAHRPGESGDSRSDDAQTVAANSTGRNACVTDLRRKRGWGEDELIVMYSGNMGLGHRFDEILEAVGRVSDELSVVSDPLSVELPRGAMAPRTTDNRQPTTPQLSSIRFVFYGDGKRRGEIAAFMAEHPERAVELHDYAPAEELAAHLQSADVHLASLDAAWTGTMVPSKLQGIFAAGRPVIFIGSGDSSIGRWVMESGGGWVVAAGDVAGLVAALDEARDPAVRETRGRAAKEFAEEHFDKRTNVARVAAILSR